MAQRIAQYALFLVLSVWLGASVYFTFFAANELFGGLPEVTFGKAVGLLFPTFFRLSAGLGILACLLYLTLGSIRTGRLAFKVGFVLLLFSALLTLVNLFVLFPMIQHIELLMGDFTTATTSLRTEFGMYHGISMLLELLSILSVVGVWMSINQCISPTWSKKG